MRQVFSSQRIENVEGVANLLRDEGIEVRITNGRSYKGNRRGTFKYSQSAAGPQPAVWVIRSEDQPRARAMLREAGLLESTRPGVAVDPRMPDPARPPGNRLRIVLLGLVVLVALLQFLR